jgi:hypothetical protein
MRGDAPPAAAQLTRQNLAMRLLPALLSLALIGATTGLGLTLTRLANSRRLELLIAAALIAVSTLTWLRCDSAVEGPVLLVLTRHNGVTAADLLVLPAGWTLLSLASVLLSSRTSGRRGPPMSPHLRST